MHEDGTRKEKTRRGSGWGLAPGISGLTVRRGKQLLLLSRVRQQLAALRGAPGAQCSG